MGEATSRAHAGVVAALLPFVLFPVAWWVIGDLTETAVRGRSDLSYLLKPPDVAPSVGRVLVAASAIGGLVLSISLHRTLRRGRPVWAALLLVMATWLMALGWGVIGRSLTVGASGASMSALVIPLVPVVLGLQTWAAIGARALARPLLPEPEPANMRP